MFIQMILIIFPQELEDLGLIQTSTTLIVSHFESWTNGSHVPLDSAAWSGPGSAVEGPFVHLHGGRNHLIPQQKWHETVPKLLKAQKIQQEIQHGPRCCALCHRHIPQENIWVVDRWQRSLAMRRGLNGVPQQLDALVHGKSYLIDDEHMGGS